VAPIKLVALDELPLLGELPEPSFDGSNVHVRSPARLDLYAQCLHLSL
jgi:hypothetical protein